MGAGLWPHVIVANIDLHSNFRSVYNRYILIRSGRKKFSGGRHYLGILSINSEKPWPGKSHAEQPPEDLSKSDNLQFYNGYVLVHFETAGISQHFHNFLAPTMSNFTYPAWWRILSTLWSLISSPPRHVYAVLLRFGKSLASISDRDPEGEGEGASGPPNGQHDLLAPQLSWVGGYYFPFRLTIYLLIAQLIRSLPTTKRCNQARSNWKML